MKFKIVYLFYCCSFKWQKFKFQFTVGTVVELVCLNLVWLRGVFVDQMKSFKLKPCFLALFNAQSYMLWAATHRWSSPPSSHSVAMAVTSATLSGSLAKTLFAIAITLSTKIFPLTTCNKRKVVKLKFFTNYKISCGNCVCVQSRSLFLLTKSKLSPTQATMQSCSLFTGRLRSLINLTSSAVPPSFFAHSNRNSSNIWSTSAFDNPCCKNGFELNFWIKLARKNRKRDFTYLRQTDCSA